MKIWPVCLATLLLASPSLLAQEYDILFQRQAKVGDKHVARLKLSIDDDEQFTLGGIPLESNKKEKLDVELTAQFEELAVDSVGRATEEKLTVQSCQCTKDGASTPLFKAGDEIKAKEGNPKVFLVNGKAAQGLAAEVLPDLLPPIDPEGESDDRVFGPGHKVKIGDSWSINKDLALANLSKKMGTPFPKDALKGSVKLDSANAKNGVPCLQLSGTLQISGEDLPLPGAPPEIKAKKMNALFLLGGDFPEDHSRPKMGESMELQFQADGGGPVGNGAQKEDLVIHLKKAQKLSMERLPAP